MKWPAFLVIVILCGAAGHSRTRELSPTLAWDGTHVQGAEEELRSTKNISASDRSWMEEWLARQYSGDPDANKRAGESRVRLLDLNGDHIPEVIVQATGDVMCSPTGNCHFWIFQKARTGYRLILEKGAAQGFTIEPHRTNGYSDLVLNMHGSAAEQGLYVFRYTKDRYQRVGCYEANWTVLDENGVVKELDQPNITPCAR